MNDAKGSNSVGRSAKARLAAPLLAVTILCAASGGGCNSGIAGGADDEADGAIRAPFGVVARAVSPTEVDLAWSTLSTRTAEFYVARGPSNGPLTELGSVPAPTLSYADGPLAPATSYSYQIVAVGRFGARASSSIVSVTTPSAAGDTDLGSGTDPTPDMAPPATPDMAQPATPDMSGLPDLGCFGTTCAVPHWVSPVGAAPWASCISATPLSDASACALDTANASAAAGDLVYLRGGTYTVTNSYGSAISPAHSGTGPSAMIVFAAAPGETPIVTASVNAYGFFLENLSYISVRGITFNDVYMWGYLINGASHNEVARCTFTSTIGGSKIAIMADGNGQPWATHNWIHDNHFLISGTGCTDGGWDTIDIGAAQGAFNNTADNDNYNTIENNFFEHAQHANLDNYGMYTVIRNNVFHNEPWSSGCTSYTNAATYSNSAYNGKYGHRNFQITEDYNRPATYVLVEGNRSGHAGVNQTNAGADNFSLAAPQNIVRYNFFYASMNPGLLFKYAWGYGLNSGGNGGTYNRVYNNTFYNNGSGYPWGHTCGLSTCPWPQSNVALYLSASGEGNVLKNNLMYQSASYTHWGSDVMDSGAPSNGWAEITGGVSNNWCTGSQASSGGCAAYGDPLFTNPDLSNPGSRTLPDLSLQTGSGAIDGAAHLTTATNSGSSATVLTVGDALFFQDGTWGSDLARASTGLGGTMQADWIAIGSVTNVVQIASVSYGTYKDPAGTITLASPMSWASGAKIWLYKKSDGALVLAGAAPDFGASERH
jgi:hypothetical protein